jgi:hypothetical protein
MNAERNRSLQARRQRYGARSAVAISRCASRTVASRSASASVPAFRAYARSQLRRVALFGAHLRSSLRRKVQLGMASQVVACRRMAVRPDRTASVASFTFLRSISLPTNTLVLTAQRLAPLGPRSARAAPAAQRGR